MQAAIADAGLNFSLRSGYHNWGVPTIPEARLNGAAINFFTFGMHAASMSKMFNPDNLDQEQKWGVERGNPVLNSKMIFLNGLVFQIVWSCFMELELP